MYYNIIYNHDAQGPTDDYIFSQGLPICVDRMAPKKLPSQRQRCGVAQMCRSPIIFCKHVEGHPSQATAWDGSFQNWLSSSPILPYTLWLFNIAMENGPFIEGLPWFTYQKWWFSMAMLGTAFLPTSADVRNGRADRFRHLRNGVESKALSAGDLVRWGNAEEIHSSKCQGLANFMRLAAQTSETCHELSDFVMTDVVMSWQMSWSVWWTISTKMSTNCLRHTLSVDTLWQVKSCPKKLIPSDELWVGYPGEPWWKSVLCEVPHFFFLGGIPGFLWRDWSIRQFLTPNTCGRGSCAEVGNCRPKYHSLRSF